MTKPICTCPAPSGRLMTAHPDPDCPQHGATACTCMLMPRGETVPDLGCPLHGAYAQRASTDDHVYNCTKDWADPRCPEHGYATPGPRPHQISQCPTHGADCPRSDECSWWAARNAGVPWFGPVGQPVPPKIVYDGRGWVVAGSERVQGFGVSATEHGTVTGSDGRLIYTPAEYDRAVALDVAARLRRLADHWHQAAKRASARLVDEEPGTTRRGLLACQVVTYVGLYQRLEREAITLETGQDFEGEGL